MVDCRLRTEGSGFVIIGSDSVILGKRFEAFVDVSAELVRDSARQLSVVIQALEAKAPRLLEGYRVLILDGNHLSGTEHRLKELCRLGAAALPGQALVVLDTALMLIVDVLAWEDAHDQERTLLEQIVPKVQPQQLWIGDRNFCCWANASPGARAHRSGV